MTYRKGFDHLGNQLPQTKPAWHHKAIQAMGWATVAVCIFILIWVR